MSHSATGKQTWEVRALIVVIDVRVEFQQECETIILILGIARMLQDADQRLQRRMPLQNVEYRAEMVPSCGFAPAADRLRLVLVIALVEENVEKLPVGDRRVGLMQQEGVGGRGSRRTGARGHSRK